MKVLLADSLPEAAVDRLIAAGDEVVSRPELSDHDLPDAIAGFQALVVRSTRITASTIAAADKLGIIVRAGAGTNTIDCDAAAEVGILVCNVPGRNALAVAELTLGLLISVDRHIADATADLRNGVWNKKAYSKGDGLFGRTMAVIGLGEIGLAVAERATAFGLNVVAIEKPGRSAEALARADRAGITFIDDAGTLLAQSDIVSLHVPGSPDTKRLVDAEFLAMMKPGSTYSPRNRAAAPASSGASSRATPMCRLPTTSVPLPNKPRTRWHRAPSTPSTLTGEVIRSTVSTSNRCRLAPPHSRSVTATGLVFWLPYLPSSAPRNSTCPP